MCLQWAGAASREASVSANHSSAVGLITFELVVGTRTHGWTFEVSGDEEEEEECGYISTYLKYVLGLSLS